MTTKTFFCSLPLRSLRPVTTRIVNKAAALLRLEHDSEE